MSISPPDVDPEVEPADGQRYQYVCRRASATRPSGRFVVVVENICLP
jgi:hypothetical protein